MSARHLSRLFTAAAFKRLSTRDIKVNRRSRHVLLDAQALVAVFGSYVRSAISVSNYHFNDDGDAICTESTLRWSKRHRADTIPSRLAFCQGEYSDSMCVDNGIVIATRRRGPAILAMVRPESTIENQLCWLFGMADAPRVDAFTVRRFPADHDMPLEFSANHILQELFINPEPPASVGRVQIRGPIPPSPPPG